MLGGGATFVLKSFIIPRGESKGLTGSFGGFSSEEFKNDGIKGAFGLCGAVSMLASIPVFIAAGKNKRRAASLSFKNLPYSTIQKGNYVYYSVTSLEIKISL